MLRADFKQLVIGSFLVGFSTVQSLMTKLVTERDGFEQDMSLFCGQKGLQLLVLLCIQMKPLQRQIGLYQPRSITQDLVDSVAATLEVNPDLQVERVGEGMYDGIIFEQGNLSVTRKQIIPIVTRCLEQGSVDCSNCYNSKLYSIITVSQDNHYLLYTVFTTTCIYYICISFFVKVFVHA